MSATRLAKIDTKELEKEVERRKLLRLGKRDPIALSNVAQLSIGVFGLDKKDADEVSRLARKRETEKAVDKLLSGSSYKPIKPSTV